MNVLLIVITSISTYIEPVASYDECLTRREYLISTQERIAPVTVYEVLCVYHPVAEEGLS